MKLTVLLAGSGFPKLRSSVTLIEVDQRRILVDSGSVDDADRLLAALDRQRVASDEIDTILCTHLHYDHCGNHLLFPDASYLVSAAELAAAREFMRCYHADPRPGKPAAAELLESKNERIKPFYVRSIVREVTRNQAFYDLALHGDERLRVVEASHRIAEGVEIVATPGHTWGHLSVVATGVEQLSSVSTTIGLDEPAEVLVAGDAVFSPPGPGSAGDGIAAPEIQLAAAVELCARTRTSLLEHFRFIVPGHGDLVDMTAPMPSSASVAFASRSSSVATAGGLSR